MSVHAGPMTKPEARAGRKEQDAAKVWKHCTRFWGCGKRIGMKEMVQKGGME